MRSRPMMRRSVTRLFAMMGFAVAGTTAVPDAAFAARGGVVQRLMQRRAENRETMRRINANPELQRYYSAQRKAHLRESTSELGYIAALGWDAHAPGSRLVVKFWQGSWLVENAPGIL